jgi:hypothetical protein
MVYVKTKKRQMKDRANRMEGYMGDGAVRIPDRSMTTLNEHDIAREKTMDKKYFQRKWLREDDDDEKASF